MGAHSLFVSDDSEELAVLQCGNRSLVSCNFEQRDLGVFC